MKMSIDGKIINQSGHQSKISNTESGIEIDSKYEIEG